MVIDREEDIYNYFKFVYVHSTHSANKGIFMDSITVDSTVKN